MADLLSLPENVMIQYILPCLDHNDLLRLRRVSKQTKAFADAYLWTPQPGHQGNWELRIDSRKDHSLQAYLQLDLPPPSRLHIANIHEEKTQIANRAEKKTSEPWPIFEDEHLEEFMERYSKYVTSLTLDKLFFPFTSAKEISFYESLVNLKTLRCKKMITVGGPSQFEEKTKRAEGSFLIRPIFKKLKIFKLERADCMDSMWNFVNGFSNNLEELLHPFHRWNEANLSSARKLIERRGMNRQGKLLYDWEDMKANNPLEPLELLRLLASCRDNGVLIKNLDARRLDCLLCDENGSVASIFEVMEFVNPISWDWIRSSLEKYERNMFVGSVIHSLKGVIFNVFLMDLPALENISAFDANPLRIHPWRGYGCPEWQNLRKIDVRLENCPALHFDFLWEPLKRPKLEELHLTFFGYWDTIPRNLGNCCENLKKLNIYNFSGDDNMFLSLWEELPLLEDVTLIHCSKLTNKGFEGNGGRESGPAFLKLKKLKHLALKNLEEMPGITDAGFKDVFRHLKLSSFELSSDEAIRSITVAGIRELLTGQFAETIEKLKLNFLMLKHVYAPELRELKSCFRVSKML